MAEKIKLSVNLYDNALTEVKGDKVPKPVVTCEKINSFFYICS